MHRKEIVHKSLCWFFTWLYAHVNVDIVVEVSEAHCVSIFSVEVNKMSQCSCMFVFVPEV
jgi:hypothetical protein